MNFIKFATDEEFKRFVDLFMGELRGYIAKVAFWYKTHKKYNSEDEVFDAIYNFIDNKLKDSNDELLKKFLLIDDFEFYVNKAVHEMNFIGDFTYANLVRCGLYEFFAEKIEKEKLIEKALKEN